MLAKWNNKSSFVTVLFMNLNLSEARFHIKF
uniref:Uncharacterized protein n=1 Tax=Rhizophora mucronata TaxID=61149 RepID=A0A2P2QKA9_RHIMU